MKLPRRNFLHLAVGAAALPAVPRTARHPLAPSAKRKPTMPGATAGASHARMPTARHGLGAAAVAGTIYVISGGPTPGTSASAANEIFMPWDS
jgi:hypothetical protein